MSAGRLFCSGAIEACWSIAWAPARNLLNVSTPVSYTHLDVYKRQIQERIAYMPQRFGLYQDLSIKENMDLFANLQGVPEDERKEKYDQLFAMTGLAPFTDRLAGRLSGGMKQKLALACALIHDPDLLILDEPTAGVDPVSRQELWKILKTAVAQKSMSVLVSTAYLEEAAMRCV